MPVAGQPAEKSLDLRADHLPGWWMPWKRRLYERPSPRLSHTCHAALAYIQLCFAHKLRPCQARDWTLANRGLDFEDAALVFDGLTAEVEDKRKDYGETRIVCFGVLHSRLVVIGYTPRGAGRHVFSMRKANDREQARFAPYFGL